jgi:uroporphyrinogen decarboxylase
VNDLHPADLNLLKAARFERPDTIPLLFHVNDACWTHYPREALEELMAGHGLLFPDFEPSPANHEPEFAVNARADEPFIDRWGCVWETSRDGIVGVVTGHPLADWAAFETFRPPDPAAGDGFGHTPGQTSRHGDPASRRDDPAHRLKRGGLRHGHTFLQLCDLRGYENLIFDMADGEGRLERLIAMVEAFNLALVEQDIAAGAQWMEYPEDLGMQTGPLLNPRQFRDFIKPSFERLMAPARRGGCVVHLHSDGHLHALIDDLLDCEIDVLNLQDRVNGVGWIAAHVKGRVCVDLDIDRQEVTVRGTPAGIDELIRREVTTLGSREGGLTLTYGLYPGVPLENIEAVMDAMERYALFFSG